MATVVITASLKDLVVPASTVVGKYEVSYKDSAGVGATQDVDTPTATFLDVPAGDYTASVVLLDSAGSPIGDPQSAAFSIAPPATATVSVPDVVTVTVA